MSDNPIRDGIERLRGHWMQHGYTDGNGNYCGFGSITLGKSIYIQGYGPIAKFMNKVALEQFPERTAAKRHSPFADFNDHADTTEDDVIAVMEQAAVRWDERV